MEFVHQSYYPGETIAAIATPLGEGGVAIIRISGNQALDIAAKVFSGPVHQYRSHTAHFGYVRNRQGEHLDDVLVLVMLGTRSYTGETTVEIHCHGGSLITRRVLEVVLEAGARAALPGEFTLRAFLNGKMDLVQAEAVQSLIGAKNERALDAAENQLKGGLSQSIGRFQHTLTQIAAILEAWIDFPEEGLEFATMDEICEDLEGICQAMENLVSTFHNGKILHDGLSMEALLAKSIDQWLYATVPILLALLLKVKRQMENREKEAEHEEDQPYSTQQSFYHEEQKREVADLQLTNLDGHLKPITPNQLVEGLV